MKKNTGFLTGMIYAALTLITYTLFLKILSSLAAAKLCTFIVIGICSYIDRSILPKTYLK